jgi:hypothetical protein
VTVRPPDSLFTVGHEYTYDALVSDGAFELQEAVPEPGTAALWAIGAGILAACYRRRWLALGR